MDPGAPPQHSPDGRWWWDGSRWMPAAPGPRGRRRWPWIAGGALALVVLLGVCVAAAGANRQERVQPAAASTPAGPPPARDGSCSPQPCANDNYGWIVTVGRLRYDAPSGSPFQRPEAGNVYVTVSVTFVNELANEQNASPFNFVLQDGAGVKHTAVFIDTCPLWAAVNLTSGASYGPKCVAFQATAGRPAGLVLVWTPHFAGGDYDINLS